MPSNLLAADVLFPHLTEKQSTDEKFAVVTDYLYMLLEQLRYTLANLGEGNFNETELQNIGNVITEPVYVQLQGLEGQMASLSVTAEGIATRVSDVEGNISTLTQTSNAISARVQSAEGNITSLTATVNGLNSTVSGLDGKYTSLSQTVSGMKLEVINGEQWSMISLTQNGVAISSQAIQITGMVTFTSLQTSGQSIINGDNIKTGTITAININGCEMTGCVYNMIVKTLGGAAEGEIKMYLDVISDDIYTPTRLGGIRPALGSRVLGGSTARVLIYANDVMGAIGGIDIQASQIRLYGDVYINDTKIM